MKVSEINREFEFSATHVLIGHNKCGRLHGHNYKGIITIEGPMAENGMIYDFNLVTKVIEQYDHMVVLPDMPKVQVSYPELRPDAPVADWLEYRFPLKDIIVIGSNSTTAENIAKAISKDVVLRGIESGYRVTKITVELWENDRSSVTVISEEE